VRVISGLLFILLATQFLLAHSIKIMWDPSSSDDLLGYRVYWGNRHSIYTNSVNVGDVTQYTLDLKQGEYFIAVTAIDYWGNESRYSREARVHVGEFTSSSNSIQVDKLYPNPFNSKLFIDMSNPKKQHVNISIYNSLGQFVKTIRDESLKKGYHYFSWDGTNQQNRTVADGTYFCRFTTQNRTITIPVFLTR